MAKNGLITVKFTKKGVEIVRNLLLFIYQFIRKTFSVPSYFSYLFSLFIFCDFERQDIQIDSFAVVGVVGID